MYVLCLTFRVYYGMVGIGCRQEGSGRLSLEDRIFKLVSPRYPSGILYVQSAAV